jgi:hypothetical protein
MVINSSLDISALEADVLKKADRMSNANSKDLANQILFLTEVYARYNISAHCNAAQRLIENYIEKCNANPYNMAYINGHSGGIYVCIKMYEATSNEQYLHKAIALVNKAGDYYLNSTYVGDSLYRGRAGMLLMLLYVYLLTGDIALLQRIDQYTRKIIANAVEWGDGLAWYNPNQLVIQPLCSFAHGAAGIGYVFEVLHKFLRHEPFLTLAEKAHSYVNKHCINNGSNLWGDYRKEIISADMLEQHISHYANNDVDFFKSPALDYSIEHGISGIAFSQMRHNGKVSPGANLDSILSANHLPDLLHLQLEQYAWHKSDACRQQCEALLLNCEFNELEELPAGILKLSYLNEQSVDIRLPKIKSGKIAPVNACFPFCSFSEIGALLAQQPFSKTLGYLHQVELVSLDSLPTQDIAESAVQFVQRQIKNTTLTQVQHTILSDVFKYEQRLLTTKIEQRQNPIFHVAELVARKNRIQSLDITDQELLKRTVVLSKSIEIRKTYFNINMGQVTILPQKGFQFWKYDTNEGVSEISLDFLGIIISRFQTPKTIETALMEILLYCNFKSEEKLKILITHTGSKKKIFLMQRIPFLFLSELRFLIADGVLEFEAVKKFRPGFKGPLLKMFLRLFRVYK